MLRSLDQLEVDRLARAAGLRSPRTVVATEAEVGAWRGPAVVKPRAHGQLRGRDVRLAAMSVTTPEELDRRVTHLREAGVDAVLQERIDGRLEAVVVLVCGGEVRQAMMQAAERTWPVPDGMTAYGRTIPVDTELVDRVGAVADELGWDGILQAQFVRDAAGRRFLIDLNGRVYGSYVLSTAAGLNLAPALARWRVHGVLPARRLGTPGRRYQWLEADLRRAVRARDGGFVRDVARVLAAAPRSSHALLVPSDPGPATGLVLEILRRRLPQDRS